MTIGGSAPMMPAEPEAAELEAQPFVDPTAELLGRAKARRPRTKTPPDAGAKKKRAASTMKRASRSKKVAAPEDADNIGNQ